MEHASALTTSELEAPLAARPPAPATAYRLLTLVDIVGMETVNREYGWQHGNDSIYAVKALLRAVTPEGDVWRHWRGDKFLANLGGTEANERWLDELPGNMRHVLRVPVTVCVLKLHAPITDDIAMLAEFMARTKRHERGRTYVHDARPR
jgi:GGDEF domain-containing protein